MRSPSARQSPLPWLINKIGFEGDDERKDALAEARVRHRVMLSAERDEFVKTRDKGEIDDEVLFRVLRELGLEEAALSRE